MTPYFGHLFEFAADKKRNTPHYRPLKVTHVFFLTVNNTEWNLYWELPTLLLTSA